MHGGFGEAAEGSPPHWLGRILVADADERPRRSRPAEERSTTVPRTSPGSVGSPYSPIRRAPSLRHLRLRPGGGPPAEGVFVWNELATSDIDAAKKFYGEVFGWSSRDMDMGDGMTYTIFEAPGGGDVAGGMPLTEEMKSHGVPPNWLSYLGTDDVDASADKAKELGATVHMPPTDIPEVGRFSVLQIRPARRSPCWASAGITPRHRAWRRLDAVRTRATL